MKKRYLALPMLLLAASCASSDAASSAREIVVEHVAFAPAKLEVEAGSEVTWINRDADVVHTATSGTPGDDGVPGLSNGTKAKPDGVFDGEIDGAGASFSFTFEEPGTYAYFCRVHQSMTGEIVVR